MCCQAVQSPLTYSMVLWVKFLGKKRKYIGAYLRGTLGFLICVTCSIFPCKSRLHFCKRLCWSGSHEQCDCLCCAQKGTKGNSSLFYEDLGATNLRQLHLHHRKPLWFVINSCYHILLTNASLDVFF